MKPKLPTIVLSWTLALCAQAQIVSSSGLDAASSAVARPAQPAASSRVLKSAGPNSRTWATTVVHTNAGSAAAAISGRPGAKNPQPTEHKIVELAGGLNFWSPKVNSWMPSVASFEIVSNRFVARRVQTQVTLESDLRVAGAVTLITPEGVPIESTPAAIVLYDAESGKSLLLGTLTNCQGVLISSNVVRYANAFAGVCADINYTVNRGSVHQDVLITGRIDPTQYGFPTNTARLQILTELYNPPTPRTVTHSLAVERDPAVRRRMATPDVLDQELHFGSLVFGLGHAYAAGGPAHTNNSSAAVSKEIVNWAERTFLVESLPYSSISQGLAALPDCVSGTAAVSPAHLGSGDSLYASIPVPPTRTKATAMAKPLEPGKQAALAKRPKVVIDYVAVVDSGTNLFQADTTYLVDGQVNFSGPVVFEGGAVIKYTGTNGSGPASLELYDSVTFNSSMYRPVIFTAIDDDTVGACLSEYEGYTGNPQAWGPYGSPALHIMNDDPEVQIHNAHFRYSGQAVQLDPACSQQILTCSHLQFIQNIVGVGMAGGGGPSLLLFNCLMADVSNAIAMETSFGTFQCINCTFDAITTLVTVDSESSYAYSECDNCILVNVGDLGARWYNGDTIGGNINGFYQAPTFGDNQLVSTNSPFMSVVRGTHYLDAATGWTVAANPNAIPAGFLPQLQGLSTYPPAVFEDRQQNDLTPQVPRDTGASALGYHYDPLDYYLGGSAVSGSALTVQAGTAIGWYGCLTLEDSTMTFQGAPLTNCWMVQNTVSQEEPWGVGAATGISLSPNYAASQLKASFTRWATLGGDAHHFDVSGSNSVSLGFNELHGGAIAPVSPASLSLTNCFLDRVSLPTTNSTCSVRNCTFYGGYFGLGRSTATIYDCAFQGTMIDWDFGSPGGTLDAGFNAMNGVSGLGAQALYYSQGRSVSTITFQSGPLGDYYLPSDSPLIDGGSACAYLLGFYHLTTQTNQSEEGYSQVDNGYHYVALDANGNPVGLDSSGAPPWITSQPSGAQLLAGSNITFTVAAIGPPTLTYQWRFNGLDIPGATASSLALTNIQLENAGIYAVLVTNANGSVLSSNAALSVFPAPAPTPLGLVSWWPAENNALDIVGPNNGNLNNGGYAAGEVGQAFSLSGTNQYVWVPDGPSLCQTNFTIEFWFKQIQNGVSDPTRFPALVAKPYGTTTTNSFAIWRNINALCAGVNASTVSGLYLTCGWPTVNAWHHIALTFDSSTMVQALYVDGGKAASGSVSSCPLFDAHALLLGARSPNGITTNFLKGYIDEATFYNRALSSTEIFGIYLAGTNGKCRPGAPQPGTVPQADSNGNLIFPDGTGLFIAEPKPTSHIP